MAATSTRTSGHEVVASPSLALVKYWGKRDEQRNVPDTSSLGITLGGLETRTAASTATDEDRVVMDGEAQPPARYVSFFTAIRNQLNSGSRFHAESSNNFPAAAGLASSSSGFAALALACSTAAEHSLSAEQLSAAARVGSASAARSVFGGFTALESGAFHARQLFDEHYWPELRVVIVVTARGTKPVSSRHGMARTKLTSPYYRSWVNDSKRLFTTAVEALEHKDLEALGTVARMSYLRMFATMFSATPPLIYWQPASVAAIQLCEELRAEGVAAWETMDAGPQVKILTVAADVERIRNEVAERIPNAESVVAHAGAGARLETAADIGTV